VSKPFRPDPEFASQLRRQPILRAALRDAAEDVARTANRIARGKFMPRKRSGTPKTFVVDASGNETRVVNTKHGGHLQEWGSVNTPPQAPLRRAARANGLRLRERPKP
jgi:hypothetical protein